MDDKKPTPKPEPPPPLEGLPGAPDWMLWFATACVILGVVILITMLAGCTVQGAAGTDVLGAAGIFDGAVLVDPSVMRGADFPHWASCRTYDPPSTMCTEPPKP